MDNSDTIDITDLVEQTRSTFVDWGVDYIFALEISAPGMAWLALPVIKDINLYVLRKLLDALTKSAVMQAFFMNTVMRKATQSKDFTDAIEAINKLPGNVTDEEYAKYEAAKLVAFRHFVSLTD